MSINDINKDIWLSEEQVNIGIRAKNKIILGDTYFYKNEFFNKVLNRFNGKFDKAPHFTIDKKGNIYQHFSLNYFSNYTGFYNVDVQALSISLENINSVELINNPNDEIEYVDWRGKVVNENVYHKCWRNNDYWVTYTNEQINKLIELLNYLCKERNINKDFINTNTKLKMAFNYEGIVTRSNFSQYYYDVNPAFKFYEIKKLKES